MYVCVYIYINIYVSYFRPNGWTQLAQFFSFKNNFSIKYFLKSGSYIPWTTPCTIYIIVLVEETRNLWDENRAEVALNSTISPAITLRFKIINNPYYNTIEIYQWDCHSFNWIFILKGEGQGPIHNTATLKSVSDHNCGIIDES